MYFGKRDSQQQLLLSLATHGIMLFITCKRLAQWHHLNLRTMKLTLQQGNRMTSGLHEKILPMTQVQIPKYIKKHGAYYRVINVFFDEKHPQQDILCLGNTPTMCELDARKFLYKAFCDKLVLDTYMDIDDDTVGSMAFKHTQFEYHGIDDNYPLTFPMLDSKQLYSTKFK